MLGKIIKHEFKDTYKPILASYLGFLLVAMLHMLTDDSNPSDSLFSFLIFSFLIIISVIIMFAHFVYFIKRYKDTVYGQQGYLTHTLPAAEWEIYFGKIITYVLWVLATITYILIIAVLFCYLEFAHSTFAEATADIMDEVGGGNIVVFALSVGIYFLYVYSFVFVCIAIGQLFNNKKTSMTVVALIAMSFITSTIKEAILLDAASDAIDFFLRNPKDFVDANNIYYIIMSAIFGGITIYINSRRLNLE